MSTGKTKVKVKANLTKTNSELFNPKTSDISKVESLNNIDSTTIQCISMTRNDEDYTLVDVSVMFKGYFKKDGTFSKVGIIYTYLNVDISDWISLRSQALRGNSVGKAVGKYLKEKDYRGFKLTPTAYKQEEF